MTIQPPLVVIKYPFGEVQDGGGHDCGGSGGMAWWGVGAAPSGETINIIEKYTKKRNGLPIAGEKHRQGKERGPGYGASWETSGGVRGGREDKVLEERFCNLSSLSWESGGQGERWW